MRAAIVISEGVDDLDAFGPFEVLANAARADADVEVRLLTVEHAEGGRMERPRCTWRVGRGETPAVADCGQPLPPSRRRRRSVCTELRDQGVEIIDARVVDDEDVVSAGGVTAGIDLPLWLVERQWGKTLADRVADEIEYERRGPLHHGPRSPHPAPAAQPN